MADTPAKPKPKVEPSKWARQPARSLDAGMEKRRQLWKGLHKFIHDNGGWIVSPPGTRDLRIEIPERSELPSKLLELGYQPLSIGQATRLTNKLGAASPWDVVDVISISLPGK